MKEKKKKTRKNIKESLKLTTLGFTLVELLAVIVILAIILVIAVPQIMNVIKDTTKASLESSAKMVAAQVENQYTIAQTLGKEFGDTGSCMEDWAGLNENDYESCTYEIDSDGNAKVTLVGKGKFKDLSVCKGTRSSSTVSEGECPLICKEDEVIFEIANAITPYEVKDYESCMSYLTPIFGGYSKEELQAVCKNEVLETYTFNSYILNLIDDEYFTKEELISNNVVASNSVWEPNITIGDYDSCVSYLSDKLPNYGTSQEVIEDAIPTLCEGKVVFDASFSENIEQFIMMGFTEKELIENNVIGSDSVFIDIKPGNQTSCVIYTKEVYVDDWGNTEANLQELCSGEDKYTSSDWFADEIKWGYTTEQELIENNVIATSIDKKCVKKGALSLVATTSTDLGVTSIDKCATSGTCDPGTAFAIKVNDTETYKFYVLSDNGSDVTLIMNRNLYDENNGYSDLYAWIDEDDYANDTNYGNNGNNDKGPLTILRFLKDKTDSWTNINPYSYILENDAVDNGDYGYEKITGDLVENVRARLPRYDELVEFTSADSGYGLYGLPSYLVENINYTMIENIYYQTSYWLSTASNSASNLAYNIEYDSSDARYYLYANSVKSKSGVRPVITLFR